MAIKCKFPNIKKCDENVSLGVNADQTGTHKIILYRFGSEICFTFEAVAGEELILPNVFAKGANTFSIENPDGSFYNSTLLIGSCFSNASCINSEKLCTVFHITSKNC